MILLCSARIKGACFGSFPATFNKAWQPIKESACLQSRCIFPMMARTQMQGMTFITQGVVWLHQSNTSQIFQIVAQTHMQGKTKITWVVFWLHHRHTSQIWSLVNSRIFARLYCREKLNVISPHDHASHKALSTPEAFFVNRECSTSCRLIAMQTVPIVSAQTVTRLVGTARSHPATLTDKSYNSKQSIHFEFSVSDSENRYA